MVEKRPRLGRKIVAIAVASRRALLKESSPCCWRGYFGRNLAEKIEGCRLSMQVAGKINHTSQRESLNSLRNIQIRGRILEFLY